MSEFPYEAKEIKRALRLHEGIYPDKITTEALREAGCADFVMALPDSFSERIRFLGECLAQLCNGVRGKDEQLTIDLRVMAATLSYLLNSTSFEDGTYHDFDKTKVDKQLRRK